MFSFKEDKQNPRIYKAIANIGQATSRGIRQAFYNIGNDLKKDSNDEILDGSKSGITYTIYSNKRKFKHQSSAPGEAPANLTGNLRKSIGFDIKGTTQLEFGSRSGPPAAGVSSRQHVADYAKALEVGNSRVAARPYLKPAFEHCERNIETYFAQEIEKELNK